MEQNTQGVEQTGSPLSDYLSDLTLAAFPIVVGLISIPLAVLLPNLMSFDHTLSPFWPFLIGALVLCGVLGLIGLLLSPGKRERLASALFFLGAFILLSDILAPLEWGLLDGENQLQEPLGASLIELVLFACLAVAWFKLPVKLVKAFGVPLALVVLASQLYSLAVAASGLSEQVNEDAQRIAAEQDRGTTVDGLPSGNVYHFVFDAYSSLGFEETARNVGLEKRMEGFTFFEKTLANYAFTDASVPSYLLGTLYQTGSFRAWQQQTRSGGLMKAMQDNGYEVELYAPDKARFWTYNGASHVRTSQEISKSFFPGSDTFRLFQISAVRITPNFLRGEVFWSTDRLFGYMVAFLFDVENPGTFSNQGFYKTISVPLLRAFLEEEPTRADRGRYVYVHVVLPHQPLVWDANCEYSAQYTSYSDQMHCASRLMGDIVDTLKVLDRYDRSLIVFQSDHGYHRKDGGQTNLEFSPDETLKDYVSSSMRAYDAEGYFRKIHALLAVKPPLNGERDLRISSAPVQLIDIPATLYDLLQWDQAPATAGRSVFQVNEHEPRELHLYSGIYTRSEKGRELVLGTTMKEAELAHISYTNGKGWKIYPKHKAYSD
jgi:hypothetical protein